MAKIETTFIRPKELYTPETGETKVVYDGYQNNPHELVVEENLEGEVSEIVNDTFVPNEGGNVVFTDGNDVEHELITKSGLGKAQVIETTWQALKDLRDNSQLIAGSLYRITDYNCTTTQENTQSANHQFDIVLLALSENKLAEEGWAMMHDNIYDVTFADGVTKKCYLYQTIETECNIVDVDTLLGVDGVLTNGEITIDETHKIATTSSYNSIELNAENIPYNYFQNSNLSAWKVWYCLDNDKSRFAWADDNVIGDIEKVIVYYPERTNFGQTIPAHDVVYTLTNETQIVNGVTYFKLTRLEVVHTGDRVEFLVNTKNINTETTLYEFDPRSGTAQAGPFSIKSINYNTPPTEEGRGVIYRLIDEWNNDCPYDFKNILYLRKVTNGDIDAQGTDTYIPTFCLYDIGNDEYKDASIFAIEYPDDEGKARPCNNIFIGSILAIDRSMDSGIYALPQNIILAKVKEDVTGWSSRDITLVNVFMCNFTNSTSHVIYLSSSNKTYVGDNNTIISQGKRVVWENIS